jgi:hypothetical protein
MIFVFGSNELGRHGGGAAKAALAHGARYGQGFGLQGNSFGIPTCAKPTNEPDSTISPGKLQSYIYQFVLFAKMVKAGMIPELPADTVFQVTRIGTGLAGWTDQVVASLFAEAPDNCEFDTAWDAAGLLPGRKYWGTYGQMVPTGSAAATAALTDASSPITIDGN